MAERRMFAMTIIDSDAFLDMPPSTQLLYFHLSMRADDDGFINKPKSIMRLCRCNDDDLKLLVAKKFIIPFESGIVVIKHWKIHNYIAKDRYTETKYKEEKATLMLDENKSYTTCIQPVYKVETQVRLGKDSIDKDIYKYIVDYLNEKAGTKYKHTSKKTQSCINGRLAEGFVLDDFYVVIDKKVKEWKGTEMEKYLSPDTLFGTKFEKYLNQTIVEVSNRKPSYVANNLFLKHQQSDTDYSALEELLKE